MIEGHFRGSTGRLRREYRKICDEFVLKSVDVMIFLTDSDTSQWREVQRNERAKFPAEYLVFAVHGVARRNIECWICADPDYIARETGIDAAALRVDDPKPVFESAMEITRDNRQEDRIADVVRRAPLSRWLPSDSFADFYEQVRDHSQRLGCDIENLRE